MNAITFGRVNSRACGGYRPLHRHMSRHRGPRCLAESKAHPELHCSGDKLAQSGVSVAASLRRTERRRSGVRLVFRVLLHAMAPPARLAGTPAALFTPFPQRLGLDERPNIRQQHFEMAFRNARRVACHVRREDCVRHGPPRMRRAQGVGLIDIERGSGDRSGRAPRRDPRDRRWCRGRCC